MADEDVVVPIETVAVDIPVHRFRVLFNDGVVMDFLAGRDDSTLREHMRKQHWGEKGPDRANANDGKLRAIVGVTDMGEEYIHTPDATAPPA